MVQKNELCESQADLHPTTGEAETGRSLSLRLVWSTELVLGWLGLHKETLSWVEGSKERINFLLIKFFGKKYSVAGRWWRMPVIPALGRQR